MGTGYENGAVNVDDAATSRSNLGITDVATQNVTQYNVLVGGASDAITSVAPGAAGRLIVSQGASVDPAFADPADSGASLKLISKQTASSSASIEFTGIAKTAHYLLISRSVAAATNGANLLMEMSNDTGSTWLTTDYFGMLNYSDYNSATVNNINSTANFPLAYQVYSTVGSVELNIQIKMRGSGYSNISGTSTWRDTATNARTALVGGSRNTVTPGCDAIRVRMSSGNIDSGVFLLYRFLEA